MNDAPTTDAAATKRYELMLVLSGKLKDEEVPAATASVKQAFSKHGAAIVDEKLWGRLKFAYEIAHEKTGVYVLWHLDLEPAKARALEHELRVTDNVLRFLLMIAPKHGAVIEAPVQNGRDSRDKDKAEPGTRSERHDRGDRAPRARATKTEASIDETLEDILGSKKESGDKKATS